MQPFFRFFILLLLFALPAMAARRPGVSRALRLENPPLLENALAERGAWRLDKNGDVFLIFTRESGGTRNLWQAVPDEETDGVWQTAPLTALVPPLWIDEAQVAPDGRSVFCLTNAVGGNAAQIARMDWKSRKLTPLTTDGIACRMLALSPDGQRLAFVRESGGVDAVFVLPINGGIARRIVTGSHPAWLDNGTLLFSNVKTGPGGLPDGLFRLEVPTDLTAFRPDKARPQFLFPRPGAATASPDGAQICLAPLDDKNGDRLYFLAPDGSGARAISGTEGARSPRFSPDGQMLIFDAPASSNGTANGTARTLWTLALLPSTPEVELKAARAMTLSGAPVEIIGTIFLPEVMPVTLEVGEGRAPQRWQKLDVAPAPLYSRRVGVWNPPAGVRGEWTLRLRAGQAESTLVVTLPLPYMPAPPADVGSAQTTISVGTGTGLTGINSLKNVPSHTVVAPPQTFPDNNPSSVPRPGFVPPQPETVPPKTLGGPVENSPEKIAPVKPETTTPPDDGHGPLPILPLPSLPPAPTSSNTNNASNTKPPLVEIEAPDAVPSVLNGNPARQQNGEEASPGALLRPMPRKNGPNPILNLPAPPVRAGDVAKPAKPKPEPKADDKPEPKNEPKSEPRGETKTASRREARLSIGGLTSSVAAGQSLNLTATVRNSGAARWEMNGAQPVRLLVRWFDSETGRRARWQIFWLSRNVDSGESLTLSLKEIMPPRAGRFRLSFALVRLTGGTYQPPATLDAPESGAQELAEVVFPVTVE